MIVKITIHDNFMMGPDKPEIPGQCSLASQTLHKGERVWWSAHSALVLYTAIRNLGVAVERVHYSGTSKQRTHWDR